ncbi:hypothetical protein T4D_13130 [Trichinella pseudospiralis]|uniref:Uncharacterized protein n=2 Tax=Trichinella pseudospiralis TaxID=6337 RepID=A0A0V1FB23_TRIPS|nr:hypothetical protein T4D_13130 [Trichinella pseudospiralis]
MIYMLTDKENVTGVSFNQLKEVQNAILNDVTRNDISKEAESTESVIICIHGTKLPSGEETTSPADRSDRSVEGGSGVLIHQGSSQRKS